jgi:hypothetical protein
MSLLRRDFLKSLGFIYAGLGLPLSSYTTPRLLDERANKLAPVRIAAK